MGVSVAALLLFVILAFAVNHVALRVRARDVERVYRTLATTPAGTRAIAVGVPRPDAIAVDRDGTVALAFYPSPLAWTARLDEQLYRYETYTIRIRRNPATGVREIRLAHGLD